MDKLSPVHKNRLLALASLLEELPRERFIYSRWVDYGWKGKNDLSCGTKACALGWASTMPMFQELGLHLEPMDGLSCGGGIPVLEAGPIILAAYSATHVVTELFGDYSGILGLFFPDGREMEYGPREVARKIQRWVKQKEEKDEHIFLRLPSLRRLGEG